MLADDDENSHSSRSISRETKSLFKRMILDIILRRGRTSLLLKSLTISLLHLFLIPYSILLRNHLRFLCKSWDLMRNRMRDTDMSLLNCCCIPSLFSPLPRQTEASHVALLVPLVHSRCLCGHGFVQRNRTQG